MRWSEIDLQPDDRKLRQFAVICASVLGVAALWRGLLHRGWIIIAVAAALIAAVGFIRARLLRGVYVATSVAAFPIGWCVSRVLLAIVFYGVFTPVALLFRIIKRDRLHRRRPLPQWHVKELPDEPARYLQTF